MQNMTDSISYVHVRPLEILEITVHRIAAVVMFLLYNNCLRTLGTMELPIANISKPPKGSRLLREPDNIFIMELKKRMIKDPSAPGAAPMAVLCKDINSVDTFEMKHKNVYRYVHTNCTLSVCIIFFLFSYEVLGGLHTLLAKSQLVGEHADNPFFKTCLAEVYVGLSDEEALRLSQRHNQTSHFVHGVTHRDLVGLHYVVSL